MLCDGLQPVLDEIHNRDCKILMGGRNTKVYSDKAGREEVMGKHGIGVMNTNGEVFADVCVFNDLVIGSSAFPRKLCTKQHGSHQMGKQIDHISIDGKLRRSLLDTRLKRKADVISDHYIYWEL